MVRFWSGFASKSPFSFMVYACVWYTIGIVISRAFCLNIEYNCHKFEMLFDSKVSLELWVIRCYATDIQVDWLFVKMLFIYLSALFNFSAILNIVTFNIHVQVQIQSKNSSNWNSFDLIFSTNIYVEPYTDKFLISMLVDFFAKTVRFCFKNLAWFHIPKSQAHTMTVLFLTLYLKMVLRRVSIQRRGGAIILKLSDFLYLWVWFQSDVLEKCLWFLSDTEKKPVYLWLCQALYRIF